MDRETPNDAALTKAALRQHGNVTREQLLNAGFDDDGIRYRVRAGRLHRVHRGVYAVGRPPQTALERASAAVLACGPTAALSHRPALALHGLAGWPASVAEVVVSEDRRPSGIRVHMAKTLLPRDVRRRHGIRVTSPARTILDCTPSLSDKRLTRLVNEAIRTKLLKAEHLEDLVLRCPTHPGAPRLKPFASTKSGISRSDLEDTFQDLVKRYRLPQPKLNTKVNGYEVDCYFEAEQLVVELDGWDFHNSRASFESDRIRDADIYETAGIPTIRLTHRRMKQQPAREAARLERVLQRRELELSRASEPAQRSEAPRP
jgi:very-short-patch-repair endonuclease